MRERSPIEEGRFWAGEELPIFGKMYFDFTEVSEITGIPIIDLRYWRTCCQKLGDRWPRPKHGRLRFTSDQIIVFLLLHELTRRFGMTMAGALDVLIAIDLEGFVAAKLDRGDGYFSRYDLNVLLQIQISRRAEILFGSSEYADLERPLVVRHLGVSRRLARGVLAAARNNLQSAAPGDTCSVE